MRRSLFLVHLVILGSLVAPSGVGQGAPDEFAPEDDGSVFTPSGLASWGDPPRQETAATPAPDDTLDTGRGFHPSPEDEATPAPALPPPSPAEAPAAATGAPAEAAPDTSQTDFEPRPDPAPTSDVGVAGAALPWASFPLATDLGGPTPYVVTAAAGLVLLGVAIVAGTSSSVPQVVRTRPFQRGRRKALAAAPRMPETALGLLGEAHHYGTVVRCQASTSEATISLRRNPRVSCEEVEGYLVGLFEAVWGRDVDLRHAQCMQRGSSATCEYHLRAVVRREVKTSVSYVPLRPDLG